MPILSSADQRGVDRRHCRSAYIYIAARQELLKTVPAEESARKARSVADAALAQGALERYDRGALAHRVRGESFELPGQLSDALEAYEQALAMNPKEGVLRRATTLRKKLSAKK